MLVTGATGYVASFLVRLLLKRGYTVHATVRSTDSSRAKALAALPGADKRLRFFEADLLTAASFDKAASGCVGAFHTASPFHLNPEKSEDFVVPARDGTKNVYTSCQKAGIARVITTSSFATILFDSSNMDFSKAHTEEHFNDTSTADSPEKMHWYRASKVEAEKVGLAINEERKGMQVRFINPPLICGPFLEKYGSLNTSNEIIMKLLDGSRKGDTLDAKGMSFVHVEDVATAHLEAYERDEAIGRFVLSGGDGSWLEVCKLLAKLCPDRAEAGLIPLKQEGGDEAAAKVPRIDASKAKSKLGMSFIGLEDILKDTVAGLLAEGFLDRVDGGSGASVES